MTEMKHIIQPLEVDKNFLLRFANACSLYQDCAVKNVDELGLGMDQLLKTYNYCWVVTRVYIEYYKVPKHKDEVLIGTYPAKVRGGFSFSRQAFIKDKNDDYVMKFSSDWILLDFTSRRMVLRPQIPYIHEEHEGAVADPQRVVKEDAKFLYSRMIHYSDCDLNNHLNNNRYIDMIQDCFDADFFEHTMIRTCQLNFEKEVRCGEVINVNVSEDKSYIEGMVGNNSVFKAKLTFGPTITD